MVPGSCPGFDGKGEWNAMFETLSERIGSVLDRLTRRGALSEAEFESGGVVTEAGMAQLRAYLSEIPAERFKTPMKAKDIPRLFTPETFCKLVITAQRDAAKSS